MTPYCTSYPDPLLIAFLLVLVAVEGALAAVLIVWLEWWRGL